jgi:hypothetical protein
MHEAKHLEAVLADELAALEPAALVHHGLPAARVRRDLACPRAFSTWDL